MKQYLLSMYQPDGDPPAPEVLEPIMRELETLRTEMRQAGAWVFSGGLHAADSATVLRAKDSEVLMTDGPYVEGKEHLGGFTIVRAPDLDAALEWGRKMALAVRLLPIEVRPFITTARNRMIDRLRRESSRADRQAESMALHACDEPAEEGPVRDDRLRLIFTCCHPALAPAARVALTLRLLGGLGTAEIARAFLVPEPAMAQRIVRAKAKIRDARIPYRIPAEADLPDRLHAVLAVVYLVFNEGYLPGSGTTLVREDLCGEAIRLGRLLADFLRRLGRDTDALAAYDAAISLAGNEPEKAFLQRRRDELASN